MKIDYNELTKTYQEYSKISSRQLDILNQMQKAWQEIINLESFTGEAADSIKSYSNDTHLKVTETFIMAFIEIEIKINSLMRDFQSSVDDGPSPIIDTDYITQQEQQIHRNADDHSRTTEELRQAIFPINGHLVDLRFNTDAVLDSYRETGQYALETIRKLEDFNNAHQNDLNDINDMLDELNKALDYILACVSNQTYDYHGEALNFDWSSKLDEYKVKAKEYYKKYLDDNLQEIIDRLPDITEENWAFIAEYAKQNPEKEMPQSLTDYILDNKESIMFDLTGDALEAFIKQLGYGISKFGGMIVTLEGLHGPNVTNSFIIVNESGYGLKLLKYGKNIGNIGKAIGVGTAVIGFGAGMYDDLVNNDKSFGQAMTHNVTSTAISIGAGAIAEFGMTGLLILFGVSNPAGWAMLAGMAAGIIIGVIFEQKYHNNDSGLQDILDQVGSKVDAAFNPMSWAW